MQLIAFIHHTFNMKAAFLCVGGADFLVFWVFLLPPSHLYRSTSQDNSARRAGEQLSPQCKPGVCQQGRFLQVSVVFLPLGFRCDLIFFKMLGII